MADDEYTQPTKADEDEVTALQALGAERTPAEDERLQRLWINRGVWKDIQKALAKKAAAVAAVVVEPVYKALSGTSWNHNKRKRPKGMPMMIYAAPPLKWSALSTLSAAIGLIAMEFSPSDITAIAIAVTALVAAIFTGAVNIIVALRVSGKVDENTTLTSKTSKLTEKTSADVETVKKDVDGMKSKDSARIAELERLVLAGAQREADAEKRAVLLAQARIPQTVVIASPAGQPTTPTVSGSAAEMSLDEIAKNTSATVDALKKP